MGSLKKIASLIKACQVLLSKLLYFLKSDETASNTHFEYQWTAVFCRTLLWKANLQVLCNTFAGNRDVVVGKSVLVEKIVCGEGVIESGIQKQKAELETGESRIPHEKTLEHEKSGKLKNVSSMSYRFVDEVKMNPDLPILCCKNYAFLVSWMENYFSKLFLRFYEAVFELLTSIL